MKSCIETHNTPFFEAKKLGKIYGPLRECDHNGRRDNGVLNEVYGGLDIMRGIRFGSIRQASPVLLA